MSYSARMWCLSLISTIFVLISSPSYADQVRNIYRVEHYAPEKIITNDEAIAALNKYHQKISDILKNEHLTGSELERIHKYSYTLEAAALKLKISELIDASISKNLNEQIETIHISSEKHDDLTVRSAFEEYDAIMKEINATQGTQPYNDAAQ